MINSGNRGVAAVVRRLNTQRRAESTKVNEEECSKEIDTAHETANRDQADYDRQLLAISVGFLGLSVAFIKDVVPLERAILRPLLYTSFVLLAATVCLVLVSYQFSILGQLKAKAYWEEKKKNASTNVPFPYRHSFWIRILNVVNGVLFAAGLIAAVTFVIINMKSEAEMTIMKVQEGALLKNPAPNDDPSKGQGVRAPSSPPPRGIHHPVSPNKKGRS